MAPGHADLAPADAPACGQPREEGLAQLPVDGLGLAPHLGRLLGSSFSASRWLSASCSPKRRILVRFDPKLSSRLLSSLSPDAAE